MIRNATTDEIEHWNQHVLQNPDGGRYLQTSQYTQFKKLSGWTTKYIFFNKVAIALLEKKAFPLGKVWYISKGPGIGSIDQLISFKKEIETFAKKHGAFMVKVDPEITYDPTSEKKLISNGLHRVPLVQPNESTITLDITPDSDTLIASLNQKTRHAIRRAERDGVTVEAVPANEENCKLMYDLYTTTAEGLWRTRSYDYYKTFWQSFEKADMGQMFFTYFNDELIASAYVIFFGDIATYKDGASVRVRTAYGASHYLQWEIIKWLKARHISIYDLCGTPPSSKIDDPSHPYYGFGRFKTSFNKHITDFIGTYDIAIRPFRYWLWRRIVKNALARLNFYRGKSYWF